MCSSPHLKRSTSAKANSTSREKMELKANYMSSIFRGNILHEAYQSVALKSRLQQTMSRKLALPSPDEVVNSDRQYCWISFLLVVLTGMCRSGSRVLMGNHF